MSFLIRPNRISRQALFDGMLIAFLTALEWGMPTSKRVASQAGKDLRDPKTPKKDRPPIASDLAQAKQKPKKK